MTADSKTVGKTLDLMQALKDSITPAPDDAIVAAVRRVSAERAVNVAAMLAQDARPDDDATGAAFALDPEEVPEKEREAADRAWRAREEDGPCYEAVMIVSPPDSPTARADRVVTVEVAKREAKRAAGLYVESWAEAANYAGLDAVESAHLWHRSDLASAALHGAIDRLAALALEDR